MHSTNQPPDETLPRTNGSGEEKERDGKTGISEREDDDGKALYFINYYSKTNPTHQPTTPPENQRTRKNPPSFKTSM